MRNYITEEAITVESAKKALIKSTDIEGNDDEMKVLESILGKCYQMGWLPRYMDSRGGKAEPAENKEFNRLYMQRSADLLRDLTGTDVCETSNRAEVVFLRRIWTQHLVSHRFTRMEVGAFCGRDHSSISTALRKHIEWQRIGCYTKAERDRIESLTDRLEELYWSEYEKYISSLKE